MESLAKLHSTCPDLPSSLLLLDLTRAKQVARDDSADDDIDDDNDDRRHNTSLTWVGVRSVLSWGTGSSRQSSST